MHPDDISIGHIYKTIIWTKKELNSILKTDLRSLAIPKLGILTICAAQSLLLVKISLCAESIL